MIIVCPSYRALTLSFFNRKPGYGSVKAQLIKLKVFFLHLHLHRCRQQIHRIISSEVSTADAFRHIAHLHLIHSTARFFSQALD